MPIKSRWTCPIPSVGLPSYVFTSPTAPLDNKKPLLIHSEHPDAVYLTHASYRLWSKRLAAGLRKAGLQPGDCVLLFSGNSIFFPVALMGIIMAGGIYSGANPTYVARELAYQLKDTGARFCITAEGSLETALEAAKSIGMEESRVFTFDDGYATFHGKGKGAGNVRHWTHLLASEEEGRDFKWEELRTPEELNRTIALNYSSGTTGVPKGVMITHRNYVANTEQTKFIAALDPEYEDKKRRSIQLCFLPMYHAFGQTYFCVAYPQSGVPVYIMPKFDFLKALENIQRFRVTNITAVPPIIVALAKHPAVKNYDLSSVENIGSGAAPLGREVSAEVEGLWPEGKMNVKQGWGMTEITCTATTWLTSDISNSSSVGWLVPNLEAKLMAEDEKNEVPAGQRGELWVRGPNVMKGYWRKPEATQETLTPDGWLKTGDVALVDEEGKLFIVDRKKELIKVKGNQVAPAELEALLLEHPGVGDAAVIGVEINHEEYPRAYIVPKVGQTPTADDIQGFMNKRVTKTKRLTGGVRFVDTIPKNPSGKILRKILRDQAKAEVSLQAKL